MFKHCRSSFSRWAGTKHATRRHTSHWERARSVCGLQFLTRLAVFIWSRFWVHFFYMFFFAFFLNACPFPSNHYCFILFSFLTDKTLNSLLWLPLLLLLLFFCYIIIQVQLHPPTFTHTRALLLLRCIFPYEYKFCLRTLYTMNSCGLVGWIGKLIYTHTEHSRAQHSNATAKSSSVTTWAATARYEARDKWGKAFMRLVFLWWRAFALSVPLVCWVRFTFWKHFFLKQKLASCAFIETTLNGTVVCFNSNAWEHES